MCWTETEITIPASESVKLDATFEKEPSFDFHCAATENKGVSGYDVVTALGSQIYKNRRINQFRDITGELSMLTELLRNFPMLNLIDIIHYLVYTMYIQRVRGNIYAGTSKRMGK